MYVFEKAASAYIEQSVKSLTDIPVLFPPFELQLEELNSKVIVMVDLLSLHVWPHSDVARKDLSTLLIQRLQVRTPPPPPLPSDKKTIMWFDRLQEAGMS